MSACGFVKLAWMSFQSTFFVNLYERTANEMPMRIQYKCQVPIDVFPEMKLRSLFISKTEL
jgi:hypothetical protein